MRFDFVHQIYVNVATQSRFVHVLTTNFVRSHFPFACVHFPLISKYTFRQKLNIRVFAFAGTMYEYVKRQQGVGDLRNVINNMYLITPISEPMYFHHRV